MRNDKRGLYYQKDKKAIIYKFYEDEEGQDDFGFDSGESYFKPISPAPLWCYAKQLSQEQLYYANALKSKEERLFVFNYLDNVTQGDTLYYVDKDQWYTVSRTDTTDDYNGELFVYAEKAKEGIASEDIRPYGYSPQISQI